MIARKSGHERSGPDPGGSVEAVGPGQGGVANSGQGAAGNNVEAPVDEDGSNDPEQQPNLQKMGGASSDYDSNVSAAAGNPRGRGAGKDKGALQHRDEAHHGGMSSEEEARDRLTNEGGPVPPPRSKTGARRGDLETPTVDRGGRYSPINNGHPPHRH